MEQSSLPPSEEKSKLNIDPNLASALAYLFTCISGIILFLLETENKRIRFHALQSILLFFAFYLLYFAAIMLMVFVDFFPFHVLAPLMGMAGFVLWLVLIVRTYQGATIKIPGIGDLAQQQVGWPPTS